MPIPDEVSDYAPDARQRVPTIVWQGGAAAPPLLPKIIQNWHFEPDAAALAQTCDGTRRPGDVSFVWTNVLKTDTKTTIHN
jgi:hypothetical protein